MSNDPLRYQMTNKRVLVTGSDTGIGRGVAIEFARAGAAVAFHYAHHINGATAAVDAIRRKGGKAQAFHADFSDVEQAQRLVDEAIQFLGGLDVLVNNAGITMNLPGCGSRSVVIQVAAISNTPGECAIAAPSRVTTGSTSP